MLLLLCALWLGLGLVGHHPWKPDEGQTMGIVKHLLDGGSWAIPSIAGVPTLQNPPLYYLSAAGGAWLLSPWLAAHDAARLVTGLWMALTLLMVGMTGREMWGKGEGRQTTFIFLGSIGLFFPAHLLTPEVPALAGYAMAFYGLALAQRRPWRAAPLIGSGIGIAFLSTGLGAAEILLLTAALLPALFSNWRRKSYLTSLATGLVIAVPWLAIWLLAAWRQSPEMLATWWVSGKHALDDNNLLYFAKTLAWYTWPALPLAAWSLWHYRKHLLQRPQFQLALLFFLVTLLLLGLGADNRDILTLPLLLPLAIMGGAAVEKLQRGAASALDWFGIAMFGTLGFLLWLGWFAMMSGYPTRLAARAHKLSEAYVPHFNWLIFVAALTVTLVWWLVVFKTNKRSNRAAVTDWAVGITMVWGLLMTLWLPWLDATKSYHSMFASMQQSLPRQYACITSRGLGDSQRALLDYYLDIKAQRLELSQRIDCDLFLVQDERRRALGSPGPEWKLIWQGKRPSDRRERFWLYQYSPGA
ncbi:MAG TPA: glycosyl transferase [Methylophilaceae bacterium]|nr:glycosyl transferase [Methylophilaceae bacterium]